MREIEKCGDVRENAMVRKYAENAGKCGAYYSPALPPVWGLRLGEAPTSSTATRRSGRPGTPAARVVLGEPPHPTRGGGGSHFSSDDEKNTF